MPLAKPRLAPKASSSAVQAYWWALLVWRRWEEVLRATAGTGAEGVATVSWKESRDAWSGKTLQEGCWLITEHRPHQMLMLSLGDTAEKRAQPALPSQRRWPHVEKPKYVVNKWTRREQLAICSEGNNQGDEEDTAGEGSLVWMWGLPRRRGSHFPAPRATLPKSTKKEEEPPFPGCFLSYLCGA